MMETIYLGDWSNDNWDGKKGKKALLEDFNIDIDVLKDVSILLAYYRYYDYSGDAYVLFIHNDILYEVHGGHCSCYGLEGQWEPEETTAESIEYRMNNGILGLDYNKDTFRTELRQVLRELNE